ncbi:hypothetical protein ACJX0J_037037, partial [Zea mays]
MLASEFAMEVMSGWLWKTALMEVPRKHHSPPKWSVILWMLVTANLWIMCSSSTQKKVLMPGFSASEMDYIDNDGKFLLSNGYVFGFGFATVSVSDSTYYVLASGDQIWGHVFHRTRKSSLASFIKVSSSNGGSGQGVLVYVVRRDSRIEMAIK